MSRSPGILSALLIAGLVSPGTLADAREDAPEIETPTAHDARMAWWREARFGMFIHWGLYAIPAGQWNGQTNHAEWIRHTAHIPVEEYDKFVSQFNPEKFDADAWVQAAQDAGMRYIVITSKHHDGFCLFDSAYTDFDVMATPFQRDIMAELSAACAQHGLRMCWYHSIMDWHHPDYLPRRGWEREQRPEGDADLDRYIVYLKNELRELLTKYGPIGVLWFDGEWEQSWNHERGQDLYDYVRGLQPDIIINNRVDVGRSGMAGLTKEGHFAGDFGTPEQEIPATGLPGVDWETCMTMNNHWGYNHSDHHWKSTEDLIRKLADIASKGGNFLLNVGPKADGTFPQESIDRLKAIGAWMKVNGDSIYGTQASPFKQLTWGRCTQKRLPNGDTRLYLHVFNWPEDGKLLVPGIYNESRTAFLLADEDCAPLKVERNEDALLIRLPPKAIDKIDTVVVLDVAGRPDIADPPIITAAREIFADTLDLEITTPRDSVELRYTLDGTEPTAKSKRASGPLRIEKTTTVRARCFRDGKPVSPTQAATFTKVKPLPAIKAEPLGPGVRYEYYEGHWNDLPEFDNLSPIKTGTIENFDFSLRNRPDHFAFLYQTYLRVPRSGTYEFFTISDDGSQLFVDDQLVVDNGGLHGMAEAGGYVALAAGLHTITVTFFERDGGDGLEVWYAGPDIDKQRIPAEALMCEPQITLLHPTPRQLVWQQMEFHVFVHFGINTFTNREWGEGDEDPALFNPTEFDARQWVRVFKDAGAKGVILTCKHHDGFCLWPSKYTDHSVASSPWRDGKGDVVREVADACREAGLKFGVYLSPWDRHEPTYGSGPRYNEHYRQQLTELLTQYGPLHEVWFDGACGEGPNGKKQVYDWDSYIALIREHQPDAVIFSDAGPDIRWVGNEQGFAGKTCWSMLNRDEFFPGTPRFKELPEGHEDGTHWVAPECDVSIRPGWFYHPAEDERVKSVAELVDIYYKSIGRNAVLLLNVPADTRGLIHDADAKRLREFRHVIDATFETNLAGEEVIASSEADQTGRFDPSNVLDGNADSCWMAGDDDEAPSLLFTLDKHQEFDRILLGEQIAFGQRVRHFVIELERDGRWEQIAEGTTIGYKRLLQIPPTCGSRLRLLLTDVRAAPTIAEFGLFKASAGEMESAGS